MRLSNRDHNVLFIECDSSQWRKNMELLVQGSKAILFLPEESSGVLEEIDFLIENQLLEKTIFLMPPCPRLRPLVMDNQRVERWNELRHFYRSKGLQMPEYNCEGSIFVLGSDRTIRYERSLTSSWKEPESIRRALNEILQLMAQRRELTSSRLRDVYQTLIFSRNPWDEYSDPFNIPGYVEIRMLHD